MRTNCKKTKYYLYLFLFIVGALFICYCYFFDTFYTEKNKEIILQNSTSQAKNCRMISLEEECSETKGSNKESFVLSGNLLVQKNFTNLEELKQEIEKCQKRKSNAKIMAKAAEDCGYEKNHPVITLAQKEWEFAQKCLLQYSKDLKNLEYPYASFIWNYFYEKGFNEFVCAGILGNIMAEVGGNTLDIQYWLDTGNGYRGMCQWSYKYYKNVPVESLEGQCDYLFNTLKNAFDSFKGEYDYNSFLNILNEKEAAEVFAKYYERCNINYYDIRKKNASIAYKYFTK